MRPATGWRRPVGAPGRRLSVPASFRSALRGTTWRNRSWSATVASSVFAGGPTEAAGSPPSTKRAGAADGFPRDAW